MKTNPDAYSEYVTWVVREDERKTMEFLLQYGASVKGQTLVDERPLDVAILWRKSSATIGTLLRHDRKCTRGVRLLLTKLHEQSLHEVHETGVIQM